MENNSSLKGKENNRNKFFLFSKKKPLANTENTKNKNHPLSQTHFQCFLFSRTKNSSWKQQPNRPLCFLCSPLCLLLLLPPSFMVLLYKCFLWVEISRGNLGECDLHGRAGAWEEKRDLIILQLGAQIIRGFHIEIMQQKEGTHCVLLKASLLHIEKMRTGRRLEDAGSMLYF